MTAKELLRMLLRKFIEKYIIRKYVHLVFVTDCGSDRGRYEIAAQRCFFRHDLRLTFFPTESMSTLHAGFTAEAHALSTIDFFGPLKDGEQIGVLVNAAPRHGSENGRELRGENRKPDGEEIYALKLRNGVWVVGPNSGLNFFFLNGRVAESFLVVDSSGRYTPFRSMENMVPVFAKIFGVEENPHFQLEPRELPVAEPEAGVFVVGWDNHGNMYLVSTMPDEDWVPPSGESKLFCIGNNPVSLRRVNDIFAGNTGEPTLTVGSLRLNGKPVYYIVVVGGSAHSMFGKPSVGTKVKLEPE